ncbi:hypothetical protein [Kribbella sp. VKM Ac-2568]|uniref:hypothetical protein n=1 Tax=Kribbella sp. VKM Ac-2568 TaxID=2512219 RepID=UPI0010511100|nr:hypothetical protein [Kribbella sp. VKM Ac-2568]TCM43413.1 hypothetical protein EV648_10932 [Kribbella sp. VKM Ac-2568]
MHATDLLSALDGLPYGERARLIAQEARRLRGTPDLAELIAELDTGEPIERALGLQLAQIAGDTDHVARLLADPDPVIQARALAAAGRGVAVSDDALRALYDDAPAALRARLLSVIRRTGRQDLAARLIDDQRDRWGDQAASALLSSTDRSTVQRLLSDLAYCLTAGMWERLARRHPESVLDHATQTLPGDEGAREEWWGGVGFGVVGAFDHDAERVFALLKNALAPDQLPSAVVGILGRLVDLDPSGVLAILTTPERASAVREALTPAVRRRLHRFSDDELAALGRLLWPAVGGLLSDLPPARRGVVFEKATSSIELARTALPRSVLRVLPQAVRQEQARRMLTLPTIREDHRQSWEVTSHLPFAKAFALLEPEVRRPDVDDRAAVYRTVINSAGLSREPASIEQALTWATRVRNERDQVRNTVLLAAAGLPPSLLTDQHVAALQTLLTDALEARDLSWSSRSALNQLAELAVRQGALGNHQGLLRWGLDAHARLTESRGTVGLYGLIDGLPRGRELAIYETLRPYVESAVKRREFDLAFAIAGAFGRRGWTIVHLHAILEQAVWSNQEYTVERAAQLWLEPTATRSERTARIIGRDVGMARWQPVWNAVTEYRTDLLDPVLAEPDRIRRFTRNHPAWQVSDAALRRWLPRQHRRYAELVAAAANDSRMPEWARAAAVSTLGHIPGVGRAAVEPFLTSDAVLLQEAALAALAWTNRPEQVLPALLRHGGDDRARVALYAATRAARFVRPSLLAETFRPVLVGEGVKVTSRKEAARLLGELRAPGASEVLTEAWADAHRDVKAAITSTASQYLLHEPASWALLQEAVHDSPATATVLAQRSPSTMASKYRSHYADLLIAVTNRSEPEVVRLALLSMRFWARFNPAAVPVCAAFITDLSIRNSTWSDGTSTLATIAAATPELALDEVLSVVRLLVRLETNPNIPNATPDRDRPARQRLTAFINSLTAAFGMKSTEARQALRLVADEVTAPEYVHCRLQLLVNALRWEVLYDELSALASLVADRPVATFDAVDQLSKRLSNSHAYWTPDDLVEPAARLAARSRTVDSLLALSLTAAAGRRAGWPLTWRTQLAELRNHPAADVRHAALDLVTASES